MDKRIQAWWQRLTAPLITINNIDARRNAQVIASISLGVLIISLIASIFSVPTYTPSELIQISPVLLGIFSFLLPYHLSRRGKIQAAAVLLAFIALALNSASTLAVGERYGGEIVYYFLAMPFFAYVYLSIPLFFLVFGLSLAAVLIFGSLGSALTLSELLRGPFINVAAMTGFTTFFVYVARLSEQEQREQLRESERKRAEQAIKQKQYDVVAMFIHAIAHDFRTRLQGISLSKDLAEIQLMKGVTPNQIQQRFASIGDNVKSMSEEISKLVLLTSIHQSNPSLESLDDILKAVEQKLSYEAETRQVNLNLPQKTKINIFCDVHLISTAIEQVIKNGIAFTPAEGSVTVDAYQDEVITITVYDTGIGIAEENFDTVFESFFKVDDARSTEKAGLGLGLPITQTIVELYGGSVTIDSELDKGTTVTLTFPRPETVQDTPKALV